MKSYGNSTSARIFCLSVLLHSANAQETLPPPAFRAGAALVLAPVRVTDKAGKTVDGLKQKDFELYEQGSMRKFALEDSFEPISLVVAIQSSAISGPALAKIQKIGSLLQPLVVGERGAAAVLTYSDNVKMRQEFTSDGAAISGAFRGIEPDGHGSAMNDAILEGVRMLAAREKSRRRVLLVVGESRDRSSENGLQEAITAAQAANVVIYPVSYSAYWTSFTSKGREEFAGSKRPVYNSDGGNLLMIFTEIGRSGAKNGHEALARYTGGMKTSFVKLKGLEDVLQKVGEDLHSQYLLSFAPSGGGENAGYREIQVRVRGCADCQVRHRPGYWRQ